MKLDEYIKIKLLRIAIKFLKITIIIIIIIIIEKYLEINCLFKKVSFYCLRLSTVERGPCMMCSFPRVTCELLEFEARIARLIVTGKCHSL